MVTEMKHPLNSFNWVFNYFHIAFAFNIQFSSHKSSSFRCLILPNSSRPSSSCHDSQLDFKIRIICKTIHFHEKVKIKKQKNKIFYPNLCHAIAWKCWLPMHGNMYLFTLILIYALVITLATALQLQGSNFCKCMFWPSISSSSSVQVHLNCKFSPLSSSSSCLCPILLDFAQITSFSPDFHSFSPNTI